MKTEDVSIIEIEALKDDMQWEVNKVEHELEVASDYAVAYRDLVIIAKCKIEELTDFVSQHKEAK